MFPYVFTVSFFYVLAPSEFTAWLWVIAMIIGGVIYNENDKIKKKVKHRAN